MSWKKTVFVAKIGVLCWLCLLLLLKVLAAASVAPAQAKRPPAAIGLVESGTESGILAVQNGGNVRVLSHLGGSNSAVVAQGTYAYVNEGARLLVIMDVANPADPTVAANLVLTGKISGLAIDGGLLMAASADGQVHSIDVSDPLQPSLLGSYSLAGAEQVVLSGQYAYVTAVGAGLYILDVTDPVLPVQTGFFAADLGELTALVVKNGFAYVGEYNHSLQIINVSDPTQPGFTGQYVGYGMASDMRIQGDYAYVLTTHSFFGTPHLHVVDITAPAEPSFVTEIHFSESHPKQLDLANNQLYLARPTGIEILSLADPEAPVATGMHEMAGAKDLFVIGDKAFVVGRGLEIVNVSDPTLPTAVGTYPILNNILEVTVAENFAYVVDRHGLFVVDVSRPENPFIVGTYDFPGPPIDLLVEDNILYAACDTAGVWLIDVSVPSQPAALGSYQQPSGLVYTVAVSGTTAFVAGEDESGSYLRALDVTVPGSIAERDTWRGNGLYISSDLKLIKGYAYVPSFGSHMSILDVRDPDAIVFVTNYDRYAHSIVVTDATAYISDIFGNLIVLDVLNPTAPVETGFFDAPGSEDSGGGGLGSSVALDGEGNIFLSAVDHKHGMRVLAGANPAALAEISFVLTGFPYSVAAAGRYGYMVSESGLTILDTPLRDLVTTTVTTAGGLLSGSQGQISLELGPSVVTETSRLTFRRFVDDFQVLPPASVGTVFEVTAVSSATGQLIEPALPYTLSVSYDLTGTAALFEDRLGLYWWNGSQWIVESSSRLDTISKTITSGPQRFGFWAVLAEPDRAFLPMIAQPE